MTATWHRSSQGVLTRGTMEGDSECPARFEFYYPNDLVDCPYIVLVCRNPHSHPNPNPSRTPQIVRNLLEELLLGMGWRLGDTNPRRLNLDSSFTNGLRRILGWTQQREPTIFDLHASLGNSDHTSRLILELRKQMFPHGTGFDGNLQFN